MPVYIGQSGDLVGCYQCLTHRQTTEDSATQFVYSIKFKLSHAIRYKTKGSIYLVDLGIGQKAFDPLPLGHKGILGNSNQEKTVYCLFQL